MTNSRPKVLTGGLVEHPVPEISVIVPAHNEAPSLELLAGRVRDVLEREGRTYEIIVVDDGSKDGSLDILRRMHDDDPRVRVRSLAFRHGKSAALDCGFKAARGSIVVTMDADLQDLPEELPTLIQALETNELDLVQACRVERNDSRHKILASWVFNRFCSLFSGLRLGDVNCGFKVIRRDVVRRLRLGDDMHRFIPILVHRMGGAVQEVPVRHARRAFGGSKYGPMRYLRGFSDLVGVVLLPRLLHAVAPALAPLGFVTLTAAFVVALVLGVSAGLGRVGALWELGLSSGFLCCAGVLCLALAYFDRMGFTRDQAHHSSNPEVRESLG